MGIVKKIKGFFAEIEKASIKEELGMELELWPEEELITYLFQGFWHYHLNKEKTIFSLNNKKFLGYFFIYLAALTSGEKNVIRIDYVSSFMHGGRAPPLLKEAFDELESSHYEGCEEQSNFYSGHRRLISKAFKILMSEKNPRHAHFKKAYKALSKAVLQDELNVYIR